METETLTEAESQLESPTEMIETTNQPVYEKIQATTEDSIGFTLVTRKKKKTKDTKPYDRSNKENTRERASFKAQTGNKKSNPSL